MLDSESLIFSIISFFESVTALFNSVVCLLLFSSKNSILSSTFGIELPLISNNFARDKPSKVNKATKITTTTTICSV